MKRFWKGFLIWYATIFFFLSLLLMSLAYSQPNKTQVVSNITQVVTVESTVTKFVTTARDQLNLFGYDMPVVSDWILGLILIGLSVLVIVLAVEIRYLKNWSMDM